MVSIELSHWANRCVYTYRRFVKLCWAVKLKSNKLGNTRFTQWWNLVNKDKERGTNLKTTNVSNTRNKGNCGSRIIINVLHELPWFELVSDLSLFVLYILYIFNQFRDLYDSYSPWHFCNAINSTQSAGLTFPHPNRRKFHFSSLFAAGEFRIETSRWFSLLKRKLNVESANKIFWGR